MRQEKTPHENLAGKRILVTGGTTGIGRATVRALAARDARLLTFGREEAPLGEVLREAGLPPECGLTADASTAADIRTVFATVDERLGGIDVLICCAALGAQPIHEMREEDWRYAVETNLLGYMGCTRAALERMIAQGSGIVVLVSSISPEIMAPGESVYAATKGGVNSFALTLRKEVGDKGVRVTVIEPGSVGSDMQPCTAEEQRAAIAQGEMLFAEEIAEAILFVLTRSSRCDVAMLRVEPIRQKTA
ncbi:SDR family oxidoreductase [Novosphingobium soli]|uniref:SDR family oxidoreductase n=1 Tax=Novosphingobium soli TaxID=574956 RepID=A0ABV6CZ18_9SPHN